MTPQDGGTLTENAPLRVGLVAAPETALTYAETIRRTGGFELIAHAGGAQAEALPGVRWFDDQRVLIAQGGVQALILDLSPKAAAELTTVALEHGVHIWRPPPLGRDLDEAAECLRRARQATAVLRVGSWWEHIRDSVRAALRREEAARPVLTEIDIAAPGPSLQSWWSGQVDAGGGVLPRDAYAPLEALIGLRGLPESVYAAAGRCRRMLPTPRETEDVAAALLRYDAGGIATLRAVWDIPPFESRTRHHGLAFSVQWNAERLTMTGANEAVEERPFPPGFLEAELLRFAQEVGAPARREDGRATLDRHIHVSALLQAIYLSARTGQPESPRQLLEVQGWGQAKA